jgi:hypothetical protein
MYSSNNNASIVREDKITTDQTSSGLSIGIYLLIEASWEREKLSDQGRRAFIMHTHTYISLPDNLYIDFEWQKPAINSQ